MDKYIDEMYSSGRDFIKLRFQNNKQMYSLHSAVAMMIKLTKYNKIAYNKSPLIFAATPGENKKRAIRHLEQGVWTWGLGIRQTSRKFRFVIFFAFL